MDASETELVGQALRGDEGACRLLYREHAGRVAGYLRRCGFGPPDMDDLLQEVFARVFRSLGTFDPARGPLRPWLATIARNVARRHWQRRAGPDHLDPELAEAMLETPGAEESGETREQIAALRGCVEALPQDLARVVRLRYVDALTTRRIAEAERMPEATVRLRLQEAKDALARCLKAKGVWP